MNRPKIENFKPKYTKGLAEIASVAKQYVRAQDEYIDYLEQQVKNCSIQSVSVPLSEYVERKQEEAWDKMGDTGNYDYATEKMNWNEENFWFGYFRALEDLEVRFLEDNEA